MSKPQRLERRQIYRGKVVDLAVERVQLPGGAEAELELISHPGAAAVVPVVDESRVILVRQYRWATGGWLLEVPAGKLDPGETPEACALREVEEETGYRASHLESLGWIWSSPGFTDERIWLYLATGLELSGQCLDEDEVLRVEELELDRAVAMAAAEEIFDAKSVCGLLRAARVTER